jgi:hypothetical protein
MENSFTILGVHFIMRVTLFMKFTCFFFISTDSLRQQVVLWRHQKYSNAGTLLDRTKTFRTIVRLFALVIVFVQVILCSVDFAINNKNDNLLGGKIMYVIQSTYHGMLCIFIIAFTIIVHFNTFSQVRGLPSVQELKTTIGFTIIGGLVCLVMFFRLLVNAVMITLVLNIQDIIILITPLKNILVLILEPTVVLVFIGAFQDNPSKDSELNTEHADENGVLLIN